MKFCRGCETEKDLKEFNWKITGKYRQAKCRACQNIFNRNYHSVNRDKLLVDQRLRWKRYDPAVIRAQNLKRSYNLTPEDYDIMLQNQNGVCAICKNPNGRVRYGRTEPLHIDHNHVTGAIRKLLCSKCNSGLGSFNDNPDLLLLAVKYLKECDERI